MKYANRIGKKEWTEIVTGALKKINGDVRNVTVDILGHSDEYGDDEMKLYVAYMIPRIPSNEPDYWDVNLFFSDFDASVGPLDNFQEDLDLELDFEDCLRLEYLKAGKRKFGQQFALDYFDDAIKTLESDIEMEKEPSDDIYFYDDDEEDDDEDDWNGEYWDEDDPDEEADADSEIIHFPRR